MKKRSVLLLVIVAMVFSGCHIQEKKPEIIVPSTIEHSAGEKADNPSKDSVQEDENGKADVGFLEEIVDVKNEEDSDNGKENIYKEQMDLVYQALSEEWSIDNYFEKEISSLIAKHYEGNALENVGYVLEDLDGDGKEELIISATSKDSSGGMLYDVYTAPNGKVVHVLSGHERNRYYLQWLEEGAYMIANEASNSAYNSAWYYYSLIGGQLKFIQGVVFNVAADEKNPWFISYDEDWDPSNDTQDVDGMAESIIEAYRRSYTTLDYIPFSAYEFNEEITSGSSENYAEIMVAVIEAKNCFSNAGFIELIAGVEESSEYTFTAESSKDVEWLVYILDEAFDDSFKYIKQIKEPDLRGDGTIFIDKGQYVYVYCSANEFTTGVVDKDAKLNVTVK